ncbi:MAG: hypothetical protein IT453_10245 [Planctomycetes bacterium]|nr:hypothetical protein [Planctomycetota bacterium]
MKPHARFIPLFAAVACAAAPALSQVQVEWTATHDGSQSGAADYGHCIAVDASGSIFLASEVRVSPSETQVDVNKYSASGALLWSKRIDAPAGTYDRPADLALAANGDVCVVGAPYFIARYDTNGSLLWSDTVGGAFSVLASVEFDAAGRAVVAGTITTAPNPSNILLRGYEPWGALSWSVEIDGQTQGPDGASSLAIDSLNNVFVAGQANSRSIVTQRGSSGSLHWALELGTVPSTAQKVISDGFGGAYVIGTSTIQILFSQYPLAYVARINSSGTLLWMETFGAADFNSSLDVVLIDNVVHCLLLRNFLGTPRIQWARRGQMGQVLSDYHYDGAAHSGARGAAFVRGSAGQLYVVGHEGSLIGSTADEVFVTQMDTAGNVDWTRRFSVAGNPQLARATTAPGNRIVACGYTYAPSTDFDAVVVQLDTNDSPQTYCTAKTGGLGCTPNLEFTGTSSAAASSGFTVIAEKLRNNKPGLFLYGVAGPAATPFGGGTLCVALPINRTPPQDSAGSPPPNLDCSGTYTLDFNAFAAGALGGNPLPALLVAGTAVYVQAWGRDPAFAPPNNVSLSNGLRYVVLP